MTVAVIGLVLLDRDGTLNRKAPEGDYVTRPDDLVMLPGAAAAVRRLNESEIPVALVTNQRGIARGRMTTADLEAVHESLRAALAREGARLDAIYHCPHDVGCRCRKPQPGMLLAAIRAFGVAPDEAVMIGDAGSDIEAGVAAGTGTVQIVGEGGRAHPGAQRTARDLGEAVAGLVDER